MVRHRGQQAGRALDGSNAYWREIKSSSSWYLAMASSTLNPSGRLVTHG
jgi:hypothetical protein